MELADSGAFGATFLSILQLQREVTKKEKQTKQLTSQNNEQEGRLKSADCMVREDGRKQVAETTGADRLQAKLYVFSFFLLLLILALGLSLDSLFLF